MGTTAVTVRTVEKVGGSEDKFYRTFDLHMGALFQWGSQRNGRSGGQFKLAPSSYDAYEQIEKKRADGYRPIAHGGEVQITVDANQLAMMMGQGTKTLGQWLDNLMTSASPASQATAPAAPPTQTQPGEPLDRKPKPAADRIADVNSRALAAIALASTDPSKAITEYALLNGDVEDLETALRKVKSYMDTLEILVSEEL